MITVLLVLLALFVLSAPFLVTVRNADQASSESADRSVLRVSLDAGERHGAARLSASHPAVDPTPYYDDLEELAVSGRFPKDFLVTDDPRQVMWDLAAEDLAGRIDLASASPHVLANLIGGATRLAEKCKDKDVKLEVSGTAGFLAEGVVLVDGEWMGYAELGPSSLGRLTRGLMVKLGADGKPAECGPSPALAHEIGAFVLDQRAFGLCEWRTAPNLPHGKLRTFEGLDELRAAKEFMLGPELGREAYLALERTSSTFGHVRAGAVWQRAVRVLADAQGEPQYGCKLAVDDVRWFNPGTTVWITDGTSSEYAMVRSTDGATLVLFEPLRAPFKGQRTIVAPLARTPVNVNTASPEVLKALWTNLKLRGKSARITAGEAEQLVDLALASRPFLGFEDFLRRFVLPAGGLDELPKDAPVRPEALAELAGRATLDASGKKALVGLIDADDARALYKNALNANDNELEFATMPLCFTARDVYQLELRAAVNAPNGSERAQGRRELVELLVPQRDLLSVWTRQEDFDEAPRLDLAASGWLSGPVPTARYDRVYGAVDSLRWPSRARAHLGPHDTQAPPLPEDLDEAAAALVYCFPAREDEAGWAQLTPYREDDQARKASYALHFDDESKELEGRYLPDGTAKLDIPKLGWSGADNLMRGMAASLWIQPRKLEEGALLLDVVGQYSDSDRLSLLFENNELVLRVLDGAGDHPTSTFKERAEVKFPLSGEGPGMPLDTWSHVQIAVDGTRPDQMALLVDGRRSEHTPGLTRLTAAIGNQSDTLQVESTDGFPDKCVVRIGDELIEVVKKSAKAFQAKFQSLGENSGFGGRLAREQHAGYPEMNAGIFKDIDHPAGSTVQLYGYSLPVFSNVPNVEAALTGDLALFQAARVEGIVKSGSEKRLSAMEPITWQDARGIGASDLGHGMDGKGDDVEGLLLLPVDPNQQIADVMKTFNPRGGYAAILSVFWGRSGSRLKDINGTQIGGVEVIRYSGWEGQTLKIAERGDVVRLKRVSGQGVSPDVAGRKSFVISYGTGDYTYTVSDQPGNPDQVLSYQVMVIPISMATTNSGGVTGFDPGNNGSAFVQLTRSGADSHLTEWVRYDEISPEGQFVRDDPSALLTANEAAGHTGGFDPPPPLPGGNNNILAIPAPKTWRAGTGRSSSVQQGGQSFWFHAMGEAEDQDYVVSRAVNSRLQFRGVLGTYQHPQPAGTQVLPVFHVRDAGETAGYPGRFDHVMFMSDVLTEPGFEGVVHHAHRPLEYLAYSWATDGQALGAKAIAEPANLGQSGFRTSLTHVALDDRLAVPFIPSQMVDDDDNPVDSRKLSRMVLFPSGELPRVVLNGQLGGDAFGAKGGRTKTGIPSAHVDEALFFPSDLGDVSGMPVQLVLAAGLGESDKTFSTEKDTWRTALGEFVYEDDPTAQAAATKSKKKKTKKFVNVLEHLPPHGGLLRIGDELLCYDSFESTKNVTIFTLPAAGRGLLGTAPQPHRQGEGVSYIGSLPLGVLASKLRADEADIGLLEAPPGFPAHGLVRIDDELVHFTQNEGGLLRMPRGSSEPGEMDGKGPGLFRGRFGTQRAEHEKGTPVILFPFRYWDRWSELADAPELTYYELSSEQPDAYWKRMFWKAREAAVPGAVLGVLQRTNAETSWDEKPEGKNGLLLFWDGKLEGEGNPIEVQSDRVEWRVFVHFLPEAFDPLEGLAHGWKTTPRLELFGVEYMGPNRTLSRIDR